jgi:hypothetical protein
MIESAHSVIETDYLVIGAGAMGMAFVDTVATESNASVVMVDRHNRPGGHWNDAYPFVRLHSAAAHYGVNSVALGDDAIDPSGLNAGFFESASAQQICAYYEQSMSKRLLPSGRVQYFPMCDYVGDGRFVSLAIGYQLRPEPRTVRRGTHAGATLQRQCGTGGREA